jgi:hypothetical protein
MRNATERVFTHTKHFEQVYSYLSTERRTELCREPVGRNEEELIPRYNKERLIEEKDDILDSQSYPVLLFMDR